MARKVRIGGVKKKPAEFTPSPQQEAIFDWFKNGEGNLVVLARAGSGKTSTIVKAVDYAPEKSILLCAFNKKIARELEGRSRRAQAKTLHGVGYKAIRDVWGKVSIDNERAMRLATAACPARTPDTILRLVAKLCTKGREMAPFAIDGKELTPIAYAFNCVPDERWEDDGYSVLWLAEHAAKAMEMAAATKPAGGIDFADMLYLPVRNKWLVPSYDMVVVDEAQDMNATQLIIAQGVCRGRIVVVGDDRQAIYAFRGADSGSISRLQRELNATQLGLTTTYRCGKKIVAEAQTIVDDIKAHTSNADGTIDSIHYSQIHELAEVGDFILSRTNAPLVRTALAILREGKRCKIEGRDIGKGLIALVRKLARKPGVSDMPTLLAALEKWRSSRVERLEKKVGAEAQIELINDQAATLEALSETTDSARQLCVVIEDLFTNSSGEPQVTCSSIHRSKGLEADRVFILADTLGLTPPCECGHWAKVHRTGSCKNCSCGGVYKEDEVRIREEQNIKYVAITRAKRELVWVTGGR